MAQTNINIRIGGTAMEYTINLTWDNEANVWTATSNDIPGLVLESGSFDALLERAKSAIQELLELDPAFRRAFLGLPS